MQRPTTTPAPSPFRHESIHPLSINPSGSRLCVEMDPASTKPVPSRLPPLIHSSTNPPIPRSASYRSSKVIHRRRGEPGFASPQTTVSNFGGRQKMGCEKLRLLLNPPIEHAGSGRRILRPNVATFSQRLSLRNPAPCRKGMLRTLRLQAETWQRRTSISLSIRQGPRAQSTNLN